MNLPEKWFFKGTRESCSTRKDSTWHKYFKDLFGMQYSFSPRFKYYSNGDYSTDQQKAKAGFTEISFETFKQYLSNNKIIEVW